MRIYMGFLAEREYGFAGLQRSFVLATNKETGSSSLLLDEEHDDLF